MCGTRRDLLARGLMDGAKIDVPRSVEECSNTLQPLRVQHGDERLRHPNNELHLHAKVGRSVHEGRRVVLQQQQLA